VAKRSILQMTETLELLIQQQAFDRIAPVVKLLLRHLQTQEEYRNVLRLLDKLPIRYALVTPEYRVALADIMSGAGQLERLETLAQEIAQSLDEIAAAPIFLEYAITLRLKLRHAEALLAFDRVRSFLQGQALGVCLTYRGLTAFQLEQSWLPNFEEGLPLLSGLPLARALINQAYCLSQSGQQRDARAAWLRALPLVRHRASTTARIRFNLAVSAQRELLPEAEEHFLELERLTQKPTLRFRRAEALNGLAMHRRSLGEWSRALASYREALTYAQAIKEQQDALNGLARVHYLSGHPARAHEVLEEALSDGALDRSALLVTRALVLLALGDDKGAAASLEAADGLHLDSVKWLALIAEAELLRRAGRGTEALERLVDLPVHGLHAREEARRHPELMRFMTDHGRTAPLPLPYVARIVVRVEARGALRVFVNARGVKIGAVSRVGELLVFLLEQGGSASAEVIGHALYPDVGYEKSRKNLWALVKLLRRALGWDESVLSLRGAYQLDPSVLWEYDVSEARVRGNFRGEFLSGVYSDWALEVGRELQELRGSRGDAAMN
jgi:tetratricopeptide (TPR) repeat protein